MARGLNIATLEVMAQWVPLGGEDNVTKPQSTSVENRSGLDGMIDALADHRDKPMIQTWTAHEVESWSYGDVGQWVHALACGLQRRLQPRETVILFGPDSPAWIIAALAVIRAGGVITPLDVQLPDDTLAHILRDSDASWVFTTTGHQARVRESTPQANIVLLDAKEGDEHGWRALAVADGELPINHADDPAALFYTSGTTGPPKGVPLSHRNLVFQLETVAASGITREADRVLLPLPLHHVYPFVIGMLAPVWLGLTLLMPYALTGPQLLRAIREGQANVIIGVPRLYSALYEGILSKASRSGRVAATLFRLLLQLSRIARRHFGLYLGKRLLAPLHRQMGKQLRVLACGGAALDKELAWDLEALGWEVAVGYGLTETSPLLTIDPPGRIRPGTVGRPVTGVSLRIDRQAAAQAGRHNRDGEILAQGPGVFSGYLNQPEKTREAFTEDQWFRTGDLGWLDEDGYLHISGRVSTLIVMAGGENIQPDELEERYATHLAIKEIGILQYQEKLVALIVPERAIRVDDEARIREALREIGRTLPSYQQLSDFALSRTPLPRTRLGKIQRHKLVERYLEVRRTGGEPAAVAPLTPQEMSAEDRGLLEYPAAQRAWQWLAQRYPKQGLTPDSSMELDLGMDSLEWLNLSLELGEQTGVELGDQAIGRVEVVRDLLRELIDVSERYERVAEPFRQAEQVLGEAERRWLRPRGPVTRVAARALYGFNRLLIHSLFQVKVEGLEQLPKKTPFVLACNHASYLDPFAVAATLSVSRLNTLYWGGWTGAAFGNPLTRFGSRIVQVIPIEQQRGMRTSLALAAMVLGQGHGLIWFPEGQRSESGELLEFRPGIGMLLEHFAVPVIPVIILGTHEAMPPGKRLPRPGGRLLIRFGTPLDPTQLAKDGHGNNVPARILDALHEKMHLLLGN